MRIAPSYHAENHNCSLWVVVDFPNWITATESVSVSKIINSISRLADNLTDSCILALLDLEEGDAPFGKIISKEDLSSTASKSLIWFTKHRYEYWCRSAPVTTKDFCKGIFLYDHSIAARNIAFLYAILHGAKSILEVSQEIAVEGCSEEWWNELILDFSNGNHLSAVAVVSLGLHVFNPYPLLFSGSAKSSTEPFGFPPDYSHNSYTHGTIAYVKKSQSFLSSDEIVNRLDGTKLDRSQGVVTQFFLSSEDQSDTVSTNVTLIEDGRTLISPTHSFTPFSIQPHDGAGFILWSQFTLWALLLPVSFSSEPIREVIRSYLAQALFRDADLKVMLRSVVQKKPSSRADEDRIPSPSDLYDNRIAQQNMTKLVEFLEAWSSSPNPAKDALLTVDGRMEQLWKDLAAADFLTFDDVQLVQLWRKALREFQETSSRGEEHHESGIIPPLRSRIPNVEVMGQFNYGNVPVPSIIFWVQKFRKYFSHVSVRGPFSNQTIQELSSHGVSAYLGPNDNGYWSPLQTLMQALIDVQNRNKRDETIQENSRLFQTSTLSNEMEGVMYVHDDAILNMTRIFEIVGTMSHQNFRHGVFPATGILASSDYNDPRWVVPKQGSLTYKIFPNGSLFSVFERKATEAEAITKTFTNFAEFQNYLAPKWAHYKRCLEGQLMLAKHPNSTRYRETDGSILFSNVDQSDFLYVPISLASEFSYAARLHLQKAPVFLECSMPTVIDMVRRKTNVSVTNIGLCTNFDYKNSRGKPSMILGCLKLLDQEDDKHFGMYHPYKLSRGLDDWDYMFDALNG